MNWSYGGREIVLAIETDSKYEDELSREENVLYFIHAPTRNIPTTVGDAMVQPFRLLDPILLQHPTSILLFPIIPYHPAFLPSSPLVPHLYIKLILHAVWLQEEDIVVDTADFKTPA